MQLNLKRKDEAVEDDTIETVRAPRSQLCSHSNLFLIQKIHCALGDLHELKRFPWSAVTLLPNDPKVTASTEAGAWRTAITIHLQEFRSLVLLRQ